MLAAYSGRWLLLFDNAPSLSAIAPVLPPVGDGCVMVTSQDPRWPGRHALEVSALGSDTAARFLQYRTGAADLDAARDLAGELGGLPLALEQAAAYMEASGRGIAEYLGMFRRMRRALLARGDLAEYDKRCRAAQTPEEGMTGARGRAVTAASPR